ncbi:uncharacterized protein NEMAJ01_2098 [Nematocida major]|uniref:uncharacterized protein n=1 Tax=Nematocida major TaxID=1912982 RepID=UPI0020088231|nr:uncharacterized protein NEMAJ01_2098 [Nematocida major]KAH9387202.1 hypothetical protein NEMAJ01_2098 [Nematocida major]
MAGEFVSDEELLWGEDVLSIVKPMRKSTGRACANCTCGKKEKEQIENEKATGKIDSSCGNCNLGDAFRCASCPFTGLPPFEANKPVRFDPDEV